MMTAAQLSAKFESQIVLGQETAELDTELSIYETCHLMGTHIKTIKTTESSGLCNLTYCSKSNRYYSLVLGAQKVIASAADLQSEKTIIDIQKGKTMTDFIETA